MACTKFMIKAAITSVVFVGVSAVATAADIQYTCSPSGNNYQTSYVPTFPVNPSPPAYNQNVTQPTVFYLGAPNYPDALCNDGSPAVYILRPAPLNGHRNRWIIHLQEGLSCYDQGTDPVTGASTPSSDCGTRSIIQVSTRTNYLGFSPPKVQATNNTIQANIAKYLGYSAAYIALHPTIVFNPTAASSQVGILASDSINNPEYWDANLVLVDYCSSDLWSGNRGFGVPPNIVKGINTNFNQADPTFTTWSFKGKAILNAVVADLWNNRGMAASGAGSAPVEVLYTGSSAGGVGVINTANDVANEFSNLSLGVRLVAMPDGGFGNSRYPQYDPTQPSPFLSLATPQTVITQSEVHAGSANSVWQATGDANCEADPSVSEKSMCLDSSFVITGGGSALGGYILLPTFIAQDMQDAAELRLLGLTATGALNNNPSNPAYPYIQRFINHTNGALIPFEYTSNAYGSNFVASNGNHNNISAAFENVTGGHMLTNDSVLTAVKNWQTAPANKTGPTASYSALIKNFITLPCNQVLLHQ